MNITLFVDSTPYHIEENGLQLVTLPNGETLIVAKWPLWVADLDRIKKYVEKDK